MSNAFFKLILEKLAFPPSLSLFLCLYVSLDFSFVYVSVVLSPSILISINTNLYLNVFLSLSVERTIKVSFFITHGTNAFTKLKLEKLTLFSWYISFSLTNSLSISISLCLSISVCISVSLTASLSLNYSYPSFLFFLLPESHFLLSLAANSNFQDSVVSKKEEPLDRYTSG